MGRRRLHRKARDEVGVEAFIGFHVGSHDLQHIVVLARQAMRADDFRCRSHDLADPAQGQG